MVLRVAHLHERVGPVPFVRSRQAGGLVAVIAHGDDTESIRLRQIVQHVRMGRPLLATLPGQVRVAPIQHPHPTSSYGNDVTDREVWGVTQQQAGAEQSHLTLALLALALLALALSAPVVWLGVLDGGDLAGTAMAADVVLAAA